MFKDSFLRRIIKLVFDRNVPKPLKPIRVKYPAFFIEEPEANIGIFGINITSSMAFPVDFSGK